MAAYPHILTLRVGILQLWALIISALTWSTALGFSSTLHLIDHVIVTAVPDSSVALRAAGAGTAATISAAGSSSLL
jgi:hypothetical protein